MKETAQTERWYFKTPVLVASFLCIGPFMLPLVWFNPRFDAKKKALVTVIVVALGILLGVMLSKSLSNINEYYGLLKQSL